jgi:hypothetical protein
MPAWFPNVCLHTRDTNAVFLTKTAKTVVVKTLQRMKYEIQNKPVLGDLESDAMALSLSNSFNFYLILFVATQHLEII